jgi:hypothetical protein
MLSAGPRCWKKLNRLPNFRFSGPVQRRGPRRVWRKTLRPATDCKKQASLAVALYCGIGLTCRIISAITRHNPPPIGITCARSYFEAEITASATARSWMILLCFSVQYPTL